MCHLIILAALLSLASGQTSDCYDQNVRYNGDSLTVTNASRVFDFGVTPYSIATP